MKLNEESVQEKIFSKNFRPTENINSKKKPIALFGCSFVQGHMLDDNQTFSYKLGKYSGRPIYVRADGGWGPQHMLFQLKNKLFYKEVPESEYVIYTYISDHINRMFVSLEPTLYGGRPAFVYKKTMNGLVFDNISNVFFHFPLLSYIKQCTYYKTTTSEKKAVRLKEHFFDSQREIKKNWETSKFVVFVYQYDDVILSIIDDLRASGIIVTSFEDLTGIRNDDIRYTISKNDIHPNEDAWNLCVPYLVKYLENPSLERISKTKKLEYKLRQQKENDTSFVLKMPIRELMKERDSYSAFSICSKDKQLIKERRITEFQANYAYVVWCFGDLFANLKLDNIANIFKKRAYHINPCNDIYTDFKEE